MVLVYRWTCSRPLLPNPVVSGCAVPRAQTREASYLGLIPGYRRSGTVVPFWFVRLAGSLPLS
jgi:hypothetical protein